MNILPKKSWHVRTKKNIDRVRKDEAEAAAKEKELQKRAKVAELEVSLDVLRKKNADSSCDAATVAPDVIDVTLVNPSGSSGAGHLNLFRDIEIHEGKLHGANAEAELDKKREAEDWEKKVGILQYLGQSTSEEQRFYQKAEKTVEPPGELSAKQQRMKDTLDPMNSFPKYAKSHLHTVPKKRKVEEYLAEKKIEFTTPDAATAGSSRGDKSRTKRGRSASSSSSSDDNSDLCRKRSRKRKKHSKHKSQTKRRKSPSSESDPESEEERKKRKKANLEILRRQRLEREERERKRTQEFLSSLAARSSNDLEEERVDSERNRRYNSQYNPHLARY